MFNNHFKFLFRFFLLLPNRLTGFRRIRNFCCFEHFRSCRQLFFLSIIANFVRFSHFLALLADFPIFPTKKYFISAISINNIWVFRQFARFLFFTTIFRHLFNFTDNVKRMNRILCVFFSQSVPKTFVFFCVWIQCWIYSNRWMCSNVSWLVFFTLLFVDE